MAEGIYFRVGQESSMTDRGAVIDDLKQCIVFVYDARIVDIDEPVHAPGQQTRRVCWVELEL